MVRLPPKALQPHHGRTRKLTVPHRHTQDSIPPAAGALSAWGVLLSPAVGAILMSASTVIVAINAQFLKRESA